MFDFWPVYSGEQFRAPGPSCLGFETEFLSISGRLIGDMEAVHCVSYPFLLFLVRIWCV